MFRNICLFLCFVITSVSSLITHGPTVDAKEYCNLKCHNETPSICDRKNEPRNEGHISATMKANMQKVLVMGHNGLRNRIAERMNVANMIKLTWNDDLALMADMYLSKNKPFETDPCTLFTIQSYNATYTYVVQNRYVQQNTHYPNILIENALRAWYLERDTMKSPERGMLQYNLRYGLLKNENNFTHLASPLTYQFGCAFDKHNSDYILICNYFPYSRSLKDEISFLYGAPGSLCPITHPLQNSLEYFANLCIGVEKNAASCENIHVLGVVLFILKFSVVKHFY